jgi:hypothetical protein
MPHGDTNKNRCGGTKFLELARSSKRLSNTASKQNGRLSDVSSEVLADLVGGRFKRATRHA